jgi:hypothetical protein
MNEFDTTKNSDELANESLECSNPDSFAWFGLSSQNDPSNTTIRAVGENGFTFFQNTL